MSEQKKDGEDICYLCEDCDKYGVCEYYYNRKPTSYICKFFKLKEDVGKWVCIGYKTEKDWINGVKSYKCPFCDEEGDWRSPYCPNCGKKLESMEEDAEGAEQCDDDCEHCEWVTCPKMEVDE